VNARNSIIAQNLHAVSAFPYYFLDDCKGGLYSHDFNLILNTNGCSITGAVSHNQYEVAPELEPLNYYGGPTATHALKPTSPAVDAGNSVGCLDAFSAPLATDQRGSPREADGNGDTVARCDMGAFEIQP
jgi:hypothetical protein